MNIIPIDILYQKFIECNQSVATDTRKLSTNSIFFALQGPTFNANNFALTAIEQGCKYAVIDDVLLPPHPQLLLVKNVLEALQQLAKYHRMQLKIPVIGITGSNGKTTNKELIHAVLSQKYQTQATLGNLNNHIGVPLTLLSITKSTEIAIIEMGANHVGEIAFLCSLAMPTFGLITNIGKAHLEGFGSIEGVIKGKSELYHYIKNNNGTIFINTDDALLIELSKNIKQITYGTSNQNSVYGTSLNAPTRLSFKWNKSINTLEKDELIETNLFGKINLINALAAICIGNYFNVPTLLISKAIQNYEPNMNRSQIKKTNLNTLILDSYNANPSSMHIAISQFAQSVFTSKSLILGDMQELGVESHNEHLQLLKQIETFNFEYVILIGSYFYKLKAHFKKYQFFKNNTEVIIWIKQHPYKDQHVLLKGSRSSKLEELEHYL